MVALPGQLFYSTQIPVCLWFLVKSKAADAKHGFRDRGRHTLFIDARKMGTLIDRVHRELTEDDLRRIVETYHSWRGDAVVERFNDQRKNISANGYADDRPASANPPPPPRSPRTATSSRPAATSAPKKSKTTANRSRKRCRASSPNCTPSSPSPRNWSRPSKRI